jgi:hypothetical protein
MSCFDLLPPLPWCRGPEVRVLLFNSTGDRDPAALLKLLQVRNQLWGVGMGQLSSPPWFWLCDNLAPSLWGLDVLYYKWH